MKAIALPLVPHFLLAGCSAFFDFNAFKTLDEPPAPSLSDHQGGSSGLAKLAADLGSPAAVDKLKADAISSLMSSVIPADAAGSEAAFSAMMAGLLQTNSTYQALGAETLPYGVPLV